METAARQLLRNGQFEEVDEDVPQLLEEFYPDAASPALPPETGPAELRDVAISIASPITPASSAAPPVTPRKSPLTNKLGKRGTAPSELPNC